MPIPKLSIIIVSWNTLELLLDCLASVESAQLGDEVEVVVVDNASTDGSAQAVRTRHPRVHLHVNDTNVGFAAANNAAIQRTHGEYVLLLNSDALLPDARTMRAWITHMDSHPRVAASGCRLIYPDGRHQVGDGGFRPSWRTLVNHSLFLSRLAPRRFQGLFLSGVKPGRTMAVDWVCGAALLLRRAVLDEVGLMDPGYFMFAEDIEWGCRMRTAGYEVHYLSEHAVVHVQRASTMKREAPFQKLWLANLKKLYRHYNPGEPSFVFDVAMGTGFALRIALYSLAYLRSLDPRLKAKIRDLSGCLGATLRGRIA